MLLSYDPALPLAISRNHPNHSFNVFVAFTHEMVWLLLICGFLDPPLTFQPNLPTQPPACNPQLIKVYCSWHTAPCNLLWICLLHATFCSSFTAHGPFLWRSPWCPGPYLGTKALPSQVSTQSRQDFSIADWSDSHLWGPNWYELQPTGKIGQRIIYSDTASSFLGNGVKRHKNLTMRSTWHQMKWHDMKIHDVCMWGNHWEFTPDFGWMKPGG